MRKRYRQDRETGELIEITSSDQFVPMMGTDDIDPFVSPVDGTVIRTRKQLEQHNKRHGVSNDLDSLKEQARKMRERQNAPLSKEERIQDFIRSYDFVQQNTHLFPRNRP